jgi:hypothetical protein
VATERTGLSILLVAPDVWDPIVIETTDPISLEELGSDSVTVDLFERRPERFYLIEHQIANQVSVFSPSEEQVTIYENSSVVVNQAPTSNTTESLEVQESSEDTLNSGWGVVTAASYKFFFTEVRNITAGTGDVSGEGVLLVEFVNSKLDSSIEATTEEISIYETSSDIRSQPDRTVESILVGEASEATWTTVSTSIDKLTNWIGLTESDESFVSTFNPVSESATLVESCSSRLNSSKEALEELLVVSESTTGIFGTYESRIEAFPLVEAFSLNWSITNDTTESVRVIEARFDHLKRVTIEDVAEPYSIAEAYTNTLFTYNRRVESIAVQESIILNIGTTLANLESLSFGESAVIGSTLYEVKTETLSVVEASRDNLSASGISNQAEFLAVQEAVYSGYIC